MRVVVNGASGRMGRAIATLASADERVDLVGGIGRGTYEAREAGEFGYEVIQGIEEAGWLIESAEVVIDVSRPSHLARLVSRYDDQLAGRGLVIGTTGIDEETERLLQRTSRRTAVLVAANFSLGIALLADLVGRAARLLGDYDIEIVEAHHRRKADAPSGTALRLADAAATARGVELSGVRRDGRSGDTGERPAGEIGMHAIRGGDIVGEHRVMLIGERERIELAHTASDRTLFADGALEAARWVRERDAGRYTMADLLKAV